MSTAVSLAEKKFDESARLLTRLAEQFGIQWQNLEKAPEYAEFVKSPHYDAWKKSQTADK